MLNLCRKLMNEDRQGVVLFAQLFDLLAIALSVFSDRENLSKQLEELFPD